MLQEVCAQKRRSIPRGRILPHPVGVKEEPRAQIIAGLMGLGAKEVDKGRESLAGQRGERRQIKSAPPQPFESAQRDDHCRSADSELLNGSPGLDVIG